MTPIELDVVSRATVGRFVWKCYIAAVIALFAKSGFLHSASQCLFLYAAIMAVLAALTRQRYLAGCFNHWSEALWLGFVGAALHLLA